MKLFGHRAKARKWARAFACSCFVLHGGANLQFAVNCSKIKIVVGGKVMLRLEGSSDPQKVCITSPSAKPSNCLPVVSNIVTLTCGLLKRFNSALLWRISFLPSASR